MPAVLPARTQPPGSDRTSLPEKIVSPVSERRRGTRSYDNPNS